jgi:hypothetical protein
MGETVEFEYKYNTSLVVLFVILFGFAAYSFLKEALAHSDILTWLKAVACGAHLFLVR